MGSRHANPGFRTIAAAAALLHLGFASTTSAQTLAGFDAITPSFAVLNEVNSGVYSVPATTAAEYVSLFANLNRDLSFDFDPSADLAWELPELAEAESSLITSGLNATWEDRSGWRAGGSVFNPAARDQTAFGLHKASSTQTSFSSDLEHPSLFTAGI